MMRDRLVQIKRLLATDGSVWVHLDEDEHAYCKVLMDEIFGRANFVTSVVWKRRNDPRNTAQFLSSDHDTLLVYAKDVAGLRTNQLERSAEMDAAYTNPDDDDRGPWRRGDLAARNYYSRGTYAIETPSGRVIAGPPSGSYWRISLDELRRLAADGRIYWGADGSSRPYLKRFLSEVAGGRVPSTVWHPEEAGFVRNGKEEVRALVGDVFSTPKPERLLARILAIATNRGDLVLDCFLGSGTTAAVAQKMGRRWIGIERSADTIDSYALPRLTKVVEGADPGGITQSVGWTGGGGFRVLDVAASMFAEEAGTVYLADWAVNSKLAESCAAQLRYAYEPLPPFSGRRGRSRLAVVDGLVNEGAIRVLIDNLGQDERVVVCGTAVDPAARALVRDLRPGSSVRKIPASILEDYRRTRWTPRATTDPAPANGTVPPMTEPSEVSAAPPR